MLGVSVYVSVCVGMFFRGQEPLSCGGGVDVCVLRRKITLQVDRDISDEGGLMKDWMSRDIVW